MTSDLEVRLLKTDRLHILENFKWP